MSLDVGNRNSSNENTRIKESIAVEALPRNIWTATWKWLSLLKTTVEAAMPRAVAKAREYPIAWSITGVEVLKL